MTIRVLSMVYCVTIYVTQHEGPDKHDYTQLCLQNECLFQEKLENAGKEILLYKSSSLLSPDKYKETTS